MELLQTPPAMRQKLPLPSALRVLMLAGCAASGTLIAAPAELAFCMQDSVFINGFEPFASQITFQARATPRGPVAAPEPKFAAEHDFVNCVTYQGGIALDATRNAYPSDFVQPARQAWTYLAWVWRENSNVNSNHTVSIARSLDLGAWHNLCDEPIDLPIELDGGEMVDSVAMHGGLLNKIRLGHDAQGRPVVTYQKYVEADGELTTQMFNARRVQDGWQRTQMTLWQTAWILEGGGALPPSPFDVWATELAVDSDGKMFQRFERAEVDSNGWPPTGDYEIGESEAGELVILGPYRAPNAAQQPDFERLAPCPSGVLDPEPRGHAMATDFHVRVVPSQYENRWFTLRGDWNGLGKTQSGLFDRWTSRFHIRSPEEQAPFIFGEVEVAPDLLPAVGDWNGDGRSGIATYHPGAGLSWLRNELSEGEPDLILPGPPQAEHGLQDAPWMWHDWNPGRHRFIRWESLPSNRDRPYDCEGNPLSLHAEGPAVIAACPEHFWTELTLWQFDAEAHVWVKEVIDQVWGAGDPTFDFLSIRDVLLIAYYDRERRLTLALKRGDEAWQKFVTDSQFIGWDRHNYLTLHVDANLDIHLSGNHHVTPLVYLRSNGLDLAGLQRLPMVGDAIEDLVTYPVFLHTPQGRLGFSFRHGGSGNGQTWLYHYDPSAKTWSRLIQDPLLGCGGCSW